MGHNLDLVSGKNILIVEDNEAHQFLIRLALDDMGHTYTILDNGEDAIEHLTKIRETKLVLLDINLPKKSGLDVLHEIKDFSSNFTIIMFTTSSNNKEVFQAYSSGANGYYVKPSTGSFDKAIKKIVDLFLDNNFLLPTISEA